MASVVHRQALDVGAVVNIQGVDKVVHVECVDNGGIEFWFTRGAPLNHRFTHEFAVIGTGHTFTDPWMYEGTAPRSPGGYVWHLISRQMD